MTTPRTHGVHLFLATILIALFALASSASSTSAGLSERELQTQFNSWMRNHGRSYNADEFLPRYQAWRSNMDFIEEFNRQGNRTFAVAMNQFGDLTPEEFGRLHKGHLSNPAEVKRRLDQESLQRQDQICGSTPAASWDWVTQGAVTPVKNQGSCGDCWAFSAVGGVEGARKIAGGSLISLSEQMLLDCAEGTGNLGCSGGNVGITYSWMINNRADLMEEAAYPYTGVQSTCMYSGGGSQGIGSYANVVPGSESDLLAKAAVGPVTVAIDASLQSFMFYSGGYYYDPSCSSTALDHAVLVVGWGSEASGDYWLVKNSWGTSWGDGGYIYMARNKGNNCGIASLAVLPCIGPTCP